MSLLKRARRWLAYLIYPECRDIGRANQILQGRVNELEGARSRAAWWLAVARDEQATDARVRRHALLALDLLGEVLG